mgnify:CR=1 FL=1
MRPHLSDKLAVITHFNFAKPHRFAFDDFSKFHKKLAALGRASLPPYPVKSRFCSGHGTVNIIEAMDKAGAKNLVHFTTDMIYGHTVTYPMTEDHPVSPLGEYGQSKLDTEVLAAEWRKRGMNISLFRPRLIIGPGRLGILEKLFKLVDMNLPVPMIGSGKNPYQFISVFDCAEAARLAWKAGVPNEAYNLGSLNPPPVAMASSGAATRASMRPREPIIRRC